MMAKLIDPSNMEKWGMMEKEREKKKISSSSMRFAVRDGGMERKRLIKHYIRYN